jgi:hypothetical protein
MWEQSLPAMAVGHSTSLQADPPLSRASPLPQEIWGEHRLCEHPKIHVGARLARDGGCTFNITAS